MGDHAVSRAATSRMGDHMVSHGKIITHGFPCKKPTWEYLYLAEPGSNPRPNRDRTPDPKNNGICDRSGVHPGSNPEPLHPDRESLPLHYMCCYMSTTEIRVFLYLSKSADFCRFRLLSSWFWTILGNLSHKEKRQV